MDRMNADKVHSEETSLSGRVIAGLVTVVCRRPWVVLSLSFLLAAVSVWAFCTRIEFRTQRNDLIDPHKDYQQRWRNYLQEFGTDEDIVVVVEGHNQERMRKALDALADRARQKPDLFDRLFYKVDLRPLQSRALLYLPTDKIRQVQDHLKDMSRLLELGPVAWPMFTLHSLAFEAGNRVRQLPVEGAWSAADQQFLSQFVGISRAATEYLDGPEHYHNPWQSLLSQPKEQKDLLSEPQYFFSPDKELAFLLVRPLQKEQSFTGCHDNVVAIRSIVDAIRPHFPDLEIGVTGLPVLESDEMVASQRDTNIASWLALAGVTVLYLLVFRGIRSPMLTVGTLLVGTAWAMGWLALTVGHVNILSATFAMMLIGLGDYGVLWITRYDQDRGHGMDLLAAMRSTARSVGPGVFTAALTTSLAFFAAMLADFQAVVELGWIAGSGVLLCALATFTVMPALLVLVDGRRVVREAPVVLKVDNRPWLPLLAGRPGWVIAVGLGITGIFGAITWGLTRYDHNLLHLQARGLDSVTWELKLINHTAGASWHALSYTSTPEEAIALKKKYKQLPVVSEVVEVASLVPPDQAEKMGLLTDIQHRLRNLPSRGDIIPHFVARPANLRAELHDLMAAVDRYNARNPKPLLKDLRLSLTALDLKLEAVPVDVSGPRLRDFEQRLTGDLAEELHRLRDVSHPDPIALTDLPVELRERYVGQTGKWLLRVFAKDCLWDYQPLRAFVRQIKKVDPEATGKPFSTLAGLRGMKHGFQSAGWYALIAIVIVLLLDFRSVFHTLLALVPLVMGVLLALGVLALCQIALNPANMIAFPLIVGVGVDNGVHVLHDYLSRRRDRRYLLSHTTGQGMLVAALTTILGFGTLMISSHQGLIGLGLILALGVGGCMVAALVFLPAVLGVMSRPKVEKTVEEVRRVAA